MPARHRTKVYGGPWQGLEWRDTYQQDHHVGLAINVDFSRAYVEGRRPFGTWNSTAQVPDRARIHAHHRPDGQTHILVIGPDSAVTPTKIFFKAFDTNGDPINGTTAVDLTASFGEPPFFTFDCSFVDVRIVGQFSPRLVTLITTRYNVYVYDPVEDSSTVRVAHTKKGIVYIDSSSVANPTVVTTVAPHDLLDQESVVIQNSDAVPTINGGRTATVTGARTFTVPVNVTGAGTQAGWVLPENGDTDRRNESNFNYWVTRPMARLAVAHQGRVIYAGFKPNQDIVLTSTLEHGQNQVPEAIVQPRRNKLRIGPQHVAWSDVGDPLAVNAAAILGMQEDEPVTGLWSFQQNLVIFTSRSVYIGAAGQQTTFYVFKAVSGIGCVAPRSIREVGGTLFWMSHDGIYAWDGSALPVKISEPIEALWTGRYTAWMPETIGQNTLATIGYPWTVNWEHAHLSCSVHYKEADQIWWSIPVRSREILSFPVQLVWDYKHAAWSMYTANPTDAPRATCMYDAVSLRDHGGQETILTTGNSAKIMRYGAADHDEHATRGVPVVFMSARHDKDNEATNSYRRVRFKVRSTGKQPAANPPKFFIVGEEAHSDIGDTDRQEQSGNMALHPDTSKAYFWNATTWNGDTWAGSDWVSLNLNTAVKSRSWHVGFVDDPNATQRPPMVTMRGYSVEVMEGEVR